MWITFNVVDGDTRRMRTELIESYGPAYKGRIDGPTILRTVSGDEYMVRETPTNVDDAMRQAEPDWRMGMFPEPAPF